MHKVVRLLILFIGSFSISTSAYAQLVPDLIHSKPKENWENVDIQKIADDSLCTSFSIWIKSGVKHHFHETHTECIYVLEGTGEMELGDSKFTVKAGDFIQVPAKTPHAVVATSPMHVLSIQTPQWKTDDRKFIEPIRRPHNE